MRITLDANILVRATTRAHGPARELLDLIRSEPRHTLVLSRYILSEVRRTLHYPRLQALYGLAVILEYYGGAAGRVPNDATAFPHRDLPWDVVIAGQWTQPAETPRHRDWARATEEALRPFSGGAHLLGALDVEPDDVINSAFGTNLTRLATIKGKYDPTNLFRVNQNIKPS